MTPSLTSFSLLLHSPSSCPLPPTLPHACAVRPSALSFEKLTVLDASFLLSKPAPLPFNACYYVSLGCSLTCRPLMLPPTTTAPSLTHHLCNNPSSVTSLVFAG